MTTDEAKRARKLMAPRPKIVVTEGVIERSKRRDSSHCMIAEAVKEAVPNATRISVDLQTIRWTDRERGLRFTYLTPRTAQLALIQFDQGDEALEPFQFSLRYAQITKSNTHQSDGKPKDSDAIPDKPGLIKTRQRDDNHGNDAPIRVGGKPPPIGPLSNDKKVRVGKRREFGLRQLSR